MPQYIDILLPSRRIRRTTEISTHVQYRPPVMFVPASASVVFFSLSGVPSFFDSRSLRRRDPPRSFLYASRPSNVRRSFLYLVAPPPAAKLLFFAVSLVPSASSLLPVFKEVALLARTIPRRVSSSVLWAILLLPCLSLSSTVRSLVPILSGRSFHHNTISLFPSFAVSRSFPLWV